MWSGPRNLSTAMMRAWGNRPDTVVRDEPFYAYYLAETGAAHPGREEVLAAQPTDWRQVVADLTDGALPPGRTLLFCKNMTHHMLPEIDLATLRGMRHFFLIRDPRQVLSSYAKVREAPTLADLGLPQQVELYRTFGGPVLDARDVLTAPERTLRELCERLGVPFTPLMLSWPAGERDTDGVWGRYWYDAVWRSTGFAPYRPSPDPLPARLERLYRECRPFYDEVHAHRIKG